MVGGAAEMAGIWLKISIANQRATLMRDAMPLRGWPVSTAKNGAGEQNNSGCTPRGWHRIRAKIGGDQPAAAVFIGRRPTGEVHSAELHQSSAGRDWILSRILWLCGEEAGKNRGGNVDSQRRYIYIHGTPDQYPLGQPLSQGCVRMANTDVIELFNQVAAGTRVLITEQ